LLAFPVVASFLLLLASLLVLGTPANWYAFLLLLAFLLLIAFRR
jgi:hypothetical protein